RGEGGRGGHLGAGRGRARAGGGGSPPAGGGATELVKRAVEAPRLLRCEGRFRWFNLLSAALGRAERPLPLPPPPPEAPSPVVASGSGEVCHVRWTGEVWRGARGHPSSAAAHARGFPR